MESNVYALTDFVIPAVFLSNVIQIEPSGTYISDGESIEVCRKGEELPA